MQRRRLKRLLKRQQTHGRRKRRRAASSLWPNPNKPTFPLDPSQCAPQPQSTDGPHCRSVLPQQPLRSGLVSSDLHRLQYRERHRSHPVTVPDPADRACLLPVPLSRSSTEFSHDQQSLSLSDPLRSRYLNSVWLRNSSQLLPSLSSYGLQPCRFPSGDRDHRGR